MCSFEYCFSGRIDHFCNTSELSSSPSHAEMEQEATQEELSFLPKDISSKQGSNHRPSD